MRRSTSSRGFSLIEVAVAVAIMAILAGAAAPLIMKSVDQAREQKTRENLKTAFEAMFGARDRRTMNMMADYGYQPAAAADLRALTTQNASGATQAYGVSAVVPYFWGWNGPYWTGSVRAQAGTNGLPVDAWGRPIIVRMIGGGPQLVSYGADGILSADDIVYPTSTGALPTTTLNITVNRIVQTGSNVKFQVAVRDRTNGALRTPAMNPSAASGWPYQSSGSFTQPTSAFTVNPGPVYVQLDSQPYQAQYSQSLVVDVMPGETRTIWFQMNN